MGTHQKYILTVTIPPVPSLHPLSSPPCGSAPLRAAGESWQVLYQIMGRHRAEPLPERKPSWLKVKAPGGENYLRLKKLMRELDLHTVCEEAHCPNVGECWEHGTATFMILGDVCTRNCAYCAVAHGRPPKFDPAEPSRVAEAALKMNLRHLRSEERRVGKECV